MPSVQRYRSGRIAEVKTLVRAGVTASVGDLVCVATAGHVDNYSSSGLTPATFRTAFLGVLAQGATKGNETTDSPALVYTFCEAEFPLNVAAAAALDPGGLVAAAGDQTVSTGAVLGAAGTGTAIGRLARPVLVGDTTALVRIESVLFGGPQPLT